MARENVFFSTERDLGLPICSGNTLSSIGFQSTNVARAAKIVAHAQAQGRPILLGMVSCVSSCGIRDLVTEFINKYNVVAIVAAAGCIQQDFIKQTGDFFVHQGSFNNAELRERGINRTANLLIPNTLYCELQMRLVDIFRNMKSVSTQQLCHILGESGSGWLAAARTKRLPVFCPAPLDGSIGDVIVYTAKHITWDIAREWREWYARTLQLADAVVLCLGSGTVKHAIINPFIGRNGAASWVHFSVEADLYGSNSGTEKGELITWGKLGPEGFDESVTVWGDFSINFRVFMQQLSRINGRDSKNV